MKNALLACAAIAFSLSACSPKPESAPEDTPATPAETEMSEATSSEITATDCAVFSASYPLNYDEGSIVMTEGTSAALDEEFKKLLPMAAACGNAKITILQHVGDLDATALAQPRAAAVTALLNEEYNIPLYNLDSQVVDSEDGESSVSIEVSFAD